MPELKAEQASILTEARRVLGDLRATLSSLPAATEDLSLLRQAFTDLDDLFLLVVAGEFNAGKSAFINALIGDAVLPEGVTPTTTAINVIRFATEPYERWLSDSVVERGYNRDWLRNLALVDTPGTNAVIRQHEAITAQFVPRSDLVLFVTSADRPFTESERVFLERIRHWGKKVVVVLNKIDLLAGPEDLAQVLAFIDENARRLLGFSPEVFPVSSRLAQQAKAGGDGRRDESLWERSRFGPLERYVLETLNEDERFRLKVLNPLGVAQRLTEEYLKRSQTQLDVLRDDVAALDTVERQLELYAQDVRRDFQSRLAEVELIVYQMDERGRRFFDETVRLGRAFDLLNSEKIRGEFERSVISDTPRRVEDAVRELSDWLVEKENDLWRMVSDYVERRRATAANQPVLSEPARSFDSARRDLLASLTRTARETMDSYDKEMESKELALAVRTALAQTAVAEAGAVGLGAVVAALATTAAVDLTGILAASVIAGLGLFILPFKKRRAQEQFGQKMEDLRLRLSGSVRQEFDRALSRTLEQVREALGPYLRFVRAEKERIEAGRAELERQRQALETLRKRVAAL